MKRADTRPVLFLAFANDRDDRFRYLRNLPLEASGLRDVLAMGAPRELWEVVERRNATLDEILDVFQDSRYRDRIVLFHFGGHADSYELTLETPTGSGAGAGAALFVSFLRQQHALRLVFLNGCSTQGHVRDLLAAGVPAVIATSRTIDDTVATDFAIRFYQGLAGGAGIRVSFEEAAASQQPGRDGSVRDVYRADVEATDERWPWELHFRAGADSAAEWNLGDSAGEPLFGLPPLPAMDLPAKPYRHLNWFAREHAHVFFGRGREIRELYERLTSHHTPPITLLYGQSGVGKSSLLASGLLPRLAAVSTTRYVRRDRDIGLRRSLRHAIGVGGAGGLRDGWVAAERTDGRPLVVLLDQMEEAFTRPKAEDPAEIDDFLADLGELFFDSSSRPVGKLLLGFRKEWLADIEDRLVRLALPHGKVFLDHLDSEGIAEAVAGPASTPLLRSQYRLTIEEGLPERIAGDLLEDRGSPIAPALQLLLSKLWDRAVEREPEAPRFDGELYTRLKREGLLLEDFLDQQLAALESWRPEAASMGLFLDFLACHTTRIGSSRPRSRSELEDFYSHQLELLPDLVGRARELTLLVDAAGVDEAPGTGSMTRLVHDAVAQLVRRRFEESDLPGQQARRLIERRARPWADGSIGAPLSEVDLTIVELALPGMRSWTPDERRLVEASRVGREVRKQKQHVAAVMRALLTAKEAQDDPLLAASLLADLAGLPDPEENIRTAIQVAQRPFPSMVLEVHDLASVNCVVFSPDGAHIATGSSDGTARIWALDGSESCRVLNDHHDEVTSVAFSPDGRLFATASLDGTAMLYHLERSRGVSPLFGHFGVVRSCSFSPDSRLLATASTDGTVRIWPCDDPAHPRVLAGHAKAVRSAEFSPRGDEILTLDEAGQVRIWRLADGSNAISLPADKLVAAAIYRSDGAAVVSASADGEIRLWPLPLATLPTSQLLANADISNMGGGSGRSRTPQDEGIPADLLLCSAPDGLRIAHTGSSDSIVVRESEVRLETVDAASGVSSPRRGRDSTGVPAREPAVFRVGGVSLQKAMFGRDGDSLLTLWTDGTARLWLQNESGGVTDLQLTHGEQEIRNIAVSRGGDHVATADADETVRIWRVPWPAQPRRVHLPGLFASRLYLSDDGEVLADLQPARGADWMENVETVRIPVEVGSAPEVVRQRIARTERSPDRTRLLARFGRRLVVVSGVGARPALIVADDFTSVRSHTFTPDGSRLLVHGTDLALHAWNLETAEREWRRRDVQEAKLSTDGSLVLTLAANGVARVLETGSGDVVSQVSGAVRAEFVGSSAADGARWICFGIRDGTTQLRHADGSGRTIRFDEEVRPVWVSPDGTIVFAHALSDDACIIETWRVTESDLAVRLDNDPPCILPAADRSWVLSMPAGGGNVTVWSVDRLDERHLLTSDAEFVHHVEERGLVCTRSRGGELRVWNTDKWNTDPPRAGQLVATDVRRVDFAPNSSRAVIQSLDGTLKLLYPDLTGVERELFDAVGWTWNPDGSCIATWHALRNGSAAPGTEILDPTTRLITGRGPWDLRVVQMGRSEVVIHLGDITSWSSGDKTVTIEGSEPRWEDNAHLSAAVTLHRDKERTPKLGVWSIRESIDLPMDGFLLATCDPRILDDALTWRIDRSCFSPGDDYWARFTDMSWSIHAFTFGLTSDSTRLTTVHAPALRSAPYTADIKIAFDHGNRIVAACSLDGAYWVSLDHLDGSAASRLLASGPGSVESIGLTSDGLWLDLKTADGTAVRIPTDGPTAFGSQHSPDSIAHVYTAADGSSITALMGDGTGRVWKAGGTGRPLILDASGRRIRLRLPKPLERDAPQPDIVTGKRGDAWITATLDDGSHALWLDDGSDNAIPLTVPGRRMLEVADSGEPDEQRRTYLSSSWIAVRLDDGSARIWQRNRPSSPTTLDVPGRQITRLRLRFAGRGLDAVLDDASERHWVFDGDRFLPAPSIAAEGEGGDGGVGVGEAGKELAVSSDGRYAIRLTGQGPVLVRRLDKGTLPLPLHIEDEQSGRFEFSADGRWIVAEVYEDDGYTTSALRIWEVDAPRSRVLLHTELLRIQGNYLHLRRLSDRATIEIVHFSGAHESLIVPDHAIAIDDETVMYVGSHDPPSGPPRPAIYIARVDQTGEPIILSLAGPPVVQGVYRRGHVVARLKSGEVCVWDLEWSALTECVRASTNVCLKPEQRRRLLGESVEEARSRWEECERARGRAL